MPRKYGPREVTVQDVDRGRESAEMCWEDVERPNNGYLCRGGWELTSGSFSVPCAFIHIFLSPSSPQSKGVTTFIVGFRKL